jgi:hypothetical protein
MYTSFFSALCNTQLPPELLRLGGVLLIADAGRFSGQAAQEDRLLGGVRLAPVVEVLKQQPLKIPLHQLLQALVLGLEAGARLGLQSLAMPEPSLEIGATTAAAVVAAGLLKGDSPEQLEEKAAAAMELPALSVDTTPEAFNRAVLAATGSEGKSKFTKLSKAFLGGIGRSWLVRTLVLPRWGGPGISQVALEGVEEILQRHLKAADKRLRADQVEHIEIRTGPGLYVWEQAAGSSGLKHWIGMLVACHGLSPEDLALAQGSRAGEVAAVASKVVVELDWKLAFQGAYGQWGQSEPIPQLLKAPFGRSFFKLLVQTGIPDPAALIKGRPDRVLRTLLRPGGSLDSLDTEAFRHIQPVQIKLYTTRGGGWPERRSQPSGSWPGLENTALARVGQLQSSLLNEVASNPPADQWLSRLKGGS